MDQINKSNGKRGETGRVPELKDAKRHRYLKALLLYEKLKNVSITL